MLLRFFPELLSKLKTLYEVYVMYFEVLFHERDLFDFVLKQFLQPFLWIADFLVTELANFAVHVVHCPSI